MHLKEDWNVSIETLGLTLTKWVLCVWLWSCVCVDAQKERTCPSVYRCGERQWMLNEWKCPVFPASFTVCRLRVQHVLIIKFVPPLLSCGLVRERPAQCLYILQGQREVLCPCSWNLIAKESEGRGAQHAHRCSCYSNAFSWSLFPLGFEIALCKILTAFFEVTK